MHRLVASATACLLVLHMLLGCCWHHRLHGADDTASQHVVVSHQDCCEGHDEDHAPDQPGRSAPSNCQHEQCTFTAGNSARASAADDWYVAAFDALPTGAGLVLEGARPLRAVEVEPHGLSHVRLHLLYRSLLI